jgi:dTDP-4-dehydrorhamnose reductase
MEKQNTLQKNIFDYSLDFLIIRTNWLFVISNNYFVSKIIDYAKSKANIEITDKELGSSTYVDDLASEIVSRLRNTNERIMHISNFGFIIRYEFAKKIVELTNLETNVIASKSSLNKEKSRTLRAHLVNKVSNNFIALRSWDIALKEFIKETIIWFPKFVVREEFHILLNIKFYIHYNSILD